jgi:hypothetical protein
MNKLFKNTNPHTPEVLYVFEHNGMVIDNPLWDSEMTSHVNPEHYGFKFGIPAAVVRPTGRSFYLMGRRL